MALRIKLLLVIFTLGIAFLLYSRFLGTIGLVIKEYKVTNSEIPASFHGSKIIHFTDLHFGRTINTKYLINLVDQMNINEPDLVFFTGDLIDRDITLTNEETNALTEELKRIDAPLGKFFVSGNHDYAHSNYVNIMEKAGFINLNNDYTIVYNKANEGIVIGGIDSELEGTPDFSLVTNFIDNKAESTYIPNYFILLLHEPDYIDKINYSKYDVDLILAGHSHGGQVRFPLLGALILPPNAKKYYEEYYYVGNTDFYISSGLGTSVVNFRSLNKPSINLYRLSQN